MDYKHAGVDIEAGYKSVELMKEHVKSIFYGAFQADGKANSCFWNRWCWN